MNRRTIQIALLTLVLGASSSGTSIQTPTCAVYATVLNDLPLFQPHGMRLVISSKTTVNTTIEHFRKVRQRARDLKDGIVSTGDLGPHSLAHLSCWSNSKDETSDQRMTRDEAEQSMRGTQLYHDQHIDETVAKGPSVIADMQREVVEQLPGIDMAMFELYQKENTQSYELTLDSCVNVPHTLLYITLEEEENIFLSCGWWNEFYRRFPGTAGITRLSVPAFDSGKSHALLYVSRSWGGLYSEGYFVGLERQGAKWIVLGTVLQHVS